MALQPASLRENSSKHAHQSALVLTKLSLIQRVLLTRHHHQVSTREGNTEKSESVFAQIVLDSHGIRLMNVTLLDQSSTRGADASAAGAGHCDSGVLGGRQDGLIIPALKLVLLAIELKGDRINSRSGIAHWAGTIPIDGTFSA